MGLKSKSSYVDLTSEPGAYFSNLIYLSANVNLVGGDAEKGPGPGPAPLEVLDHLDLVDDGDLVGLVEVSTSSHQIPIEISQLIKITVFNLSPSSTDFWLDALVPG